MSAPFPAPPPPSARPKTARPAPHAPTLESVTTINEDGSHYKLHPADSRGPFLLWRRISAWVLIAIYLSLPWIPVDGYPAVLLDVANSRFHFFGYTLAAQDAWLLFFVVTGLGFSLFFVTALLGRLWCGWACPQTVFLEHVYRHIERLIEGDAPARRALDAAPWSGNKLARRLAKHGAFLAVSLVIAHLFLAYFVSIPELWSFMRSAPGEHWAAFVFVFLFAGILYFNFSWFREQLCIVICPYGRLQSALTDDHTMVIGYDARRGEPRMTLADARKRHESHVSAGLPSEALAKEGACVACNRCVQVCPTGIDIRHGLQLECIGCAACIDACDEVMTRVHRPTGLIRYDSLAGLGGGRTRWVRPRTIVYAVLLFIGAAVAAFAYTTVKPASFLVYRMGGGAYFVDREIVRNQFMVRLLNKRSDAAAFEVQVDAPGYVHRSGLEQPVTLAPMAEQVTPLVLTVDRGRYEGSFKFMVRVRDIAGHFTLQREVEFLGPDPRLLREEDHDKGIKR